MFQILQLFEVAELSSGLEAGSARFLNFEGGRKLQAEPLTFTFDSCQFDVSSHAGDKLLHVPLTVSQLFKISVELGSRGTVNEFRVEPSPIERE